MNIKNNESISTNSGLKNLNSSSNFLGKKMQIEVVVTRKDSIKNSSITKEELNNKLREKQ